MRRTLHKALPVLLLAVCTFTPNAAYSQPINDMANMQNAQNASAQAVGGEAVAAPHIMQWFQRYDQIRRQAQMSPAERQKADNLLSKGLSIIVPGEEKTVTQNLLNKLVNRYQVASEQMKQLPVFPETEKLHRGYYQYFCDAGKLFGDYIKVQNSLFVVDETTGKPLAGTLMVRKQNLEMLDQANKALDEQVRQQFGIAAYKY